MSIYIGYRPADKLPIIADYCAAHSVRQTIVIHADGYPLAVPGAQLVPYSETIMYRTFYPLLQKIDGDTLLVLDETLRTQDRYDLAYNCIRNFLNQTDHVLVFQQLPQIDTREDFMILFDFATRSRWKRYKYDIDLILDNVTVQVQPFAPHFGRIDVPTRPATQRQYSRERERRFATIGARDPHTIPRNLYLVGGKDKAAHIDACHTAQLSLLNGTGQPSCTYVARNKRLNRPNIVTYADVTADGGPYTIVELPHRFIEFSDFLKTTWQQQIGVLVADLKVDHWYYQRYLDWSDRIHATTADLQQS